MTKPIITKAIKPPARDADIAVSRLEDTKAGPFNSCPARPLPSSADPEGIHHNHHVYTRDALQASWGGIKKTRL